MNLKRSIRDGWLFVFVMVVLLFLKAVEPGYKMYRSAYEALS